MLPKEIQEYLAQREVAYTLIQHDPTDSAIQAALGLGIDPARVAVASLVKDKLGTLLLVYPSSSLLDMEALNNNLRREFALLPSNEIGMEFPVYSHGQCLPLAMVYQIGAEVHSSFTNSKDVYFSVSNTTLCQISGSHFCLLQGPAMYDDFFVQLQKIKSNKPTQQFRRNRKEIIRQRLEKIDSLPAMPTIAQRLLHLSNNPYAGARDLAMVIEQDPSLSAQLVRYARSPLYGFTGDLHSIQDVVSRVLGFDMVLDMAIGVSVGRMFRNPREGKLGLEDYWRHAIFCAVLTQKLTAAVKGPHKARPGMAYLCGLLHNFGFLLLGHLFPQEFMMLNKAITKFPNNSVIDLENTVVGVTHMELGVWLMKAWNMQDEIVLSIREHHNEYYRDAHCVYPNLVLVANRLLHEMEFGDEISSTIPQGLIDHLGLDMDKVQQILEQTLSEGQGLEYMALQMAA